MQEPYSSNDRNKHTRRNYDFCIVDNVNEGNPIFCVLGLRSTSETDSNKTSLSRATNERWTSKCTNDPSKIVLILSSYAWNDTPSTYVERNDVAEDPQNIIYSTGKKLRIRVQLIVVVTLTAYPKAHLLTKTEFKTPPSTNYPMGKSFGDFTSCSRIISMDLKNG